MSPASAQANSLSALFILLLVTALFFVSCLLFGLIFADRFAGHVARVLRGIPGLRFGSSRQGISSIRTLQRGSSPDLYLFLVQIRFRGLLDASHAVARALSGDDQFVKLQLQRKRIAGLGMLN